MHYVITKSLPETARKAVTALHDFIDVASDFVDRPRGKTSHEQRSAIEEYRRRTIAAIRDPETENDPVVKLFARVVRDHTIPELEIHAFLDAIASDASKKTYKDLHELEHYLRGSAAAISAMILAITGYSGERETVKRQLRSLAEATRMMYFLRDIDADYTLGRVYLPQTSMQKHGATDEDIAKKRLTPGMRRVIHELAVWTRNKYHDGVSGIKHLPKECRFAVLLSVVIALRILEKIEKNGPFGKHASVSGIERAHLVASTAVKYKTLKQSELKICKLTHA